MLSCPGHYNSNILARFLRSLFPGSRCIPCRPLEAGGHPTHTSQQASATSSRFPIPVDMPLLILPDLYAVFMTLTSSALCDIRITLVRLTSVHFVTVRSMSSSSKLSPFPRSLHPHVWFLYIDGLSHAVVSETKAQRTVRQLHLTFPQATQIQHTQKLNSILKPSASEITGSCVINRHLHSSVGLCTF